MANTTSSPKRQRRPGKQSFKPDPKRMRPLMRKTTMGLAFEKLMASIGLDHPGAPMIRDAQWEGSR